MEKCELLSRHVKDVRFQDWSCLPPLVLEKIYSFLNREDQSRMSAVCKKWSREFSAPGLWKMVQYVLPDYSYSTKIRPEIQWTRKYGHMFRHVEIICEPYQLNHEEIAMQQFKTFLEALSTYCQLSMLTFSNLGNYLAILDETALEGSIQSIVNLLWTQNKLTSVEFRNSNFVEDEAIKVLTALCFKNSQTLRSLNLEGFIFKSKDDSMPILSICSSITDTHPFYDILMNLNEIVVDYSLIFESIITSCFQNSCSNSTSGRQSHLKIMKLICDLSSSHNFHGIPSEAWKYFRTLCPALKIDLLFHTSSSIRNKMDVFVVRHMPLQTLNLRSVEFNEDEVDSLLSHIVSCSCNTFLEVLIVVWPQNDSYFTRDLLLFQQVCLKLKKLKLYIRHPALGLNTIFRWWLENGKISLNEAHIIIENIKTFEDTTIYANLVDEYASLLLKLGLNLIFEVTYD